MIRQGIGAFGRQRLSPSSRATGHKRFTTAAATRTASLETKGLANNKTPPSAANHQTDIVRMNVDRPCDHVL